MGSSRSLPMQPDNPQAGLRFLLLGPPTILWNQNPITIPRRSVRALLYFLACDPEPVNRGNLHLLFWPDVPEVDARRNLTHHLTHLRRSLPLKAILAADSSRIWLEPGMVWCDVIQFQKAAHGYKADIPSLTGLANLYRGPFLEGFDLPGCNEYEHWCIVERAALENQYLKILGRLVEQCSSRGETSKAIYWAQRYLEIDPLSEAIHCQLIQLFAAAGDRHLALNQYKSCVEILDSELGVSPLPKTTAIFKAVLLGWHRFPSRSPSTPQIRIPMQDIPILGREMELKLLEEAFRNLQSQRSQILLISGEAGIGKSRLMHHFAESKLKNARLLYGAAYAGEEAIPYQPILQAFRRILGLREPGMERNCNRLTQDPLPADLIDPLWLSELSRLFPELQILMNARFMDASIPEAGLLQSRSFRSGSRVDITHSQSLV